MKRRKGYFQTRKTERKRGWQRKISLFVALILILSAITPTVAFGSMETEAGTETILSEQTDVAEDVADVQAESVHEEVVGEHDLTQDQSLDFEERDAVEETALEFDQTTLNASDLELTDEATGIRVSIPVASFPEHVTSTTIGIRVRDLTDEELNTYLNNVGITEESLYWVYDIALINTETEEEVQPTGSVTVTIPEKTPSDAIVAHMDDEGNVTEPETTVTDDEVIVENDHFSTYGSYADTGQFYEGYSEGKNNATAMNFYRVSRNPVTIGESYTPPYGSSTHSNDLVAYCFNYYALRPNVEGSYNDNNLNVQHVSGHTHYSRTTDVVQFLENLDNKATVFIAYDPITGQPVKYDSSKRTVEQAEVFRNTLLKVLYNGYGSSSDGAKAIQGNATDTQFRQATQRAVYYFVNGKTDAADGYGSEVKRIFNALITGQGEEPPEGRTLYIYQFILPAEGSYTSSSGKHPSPTYNGKVSYQNLLTAEFVEYPGHQVKFGKYSFGAVDGEDSLIGAEVEILKDTASQEIVSQWVTDGTEKSVYLEAGNYIFRETKAPDGYEKVPDIHFTVDSNGKVTITSVTGRTGTDYSDVAKIDNNQFSIYDKEEDTSFKVLKTWEDGMIPEPVTLQLQKDGVDVAGKTITLDGTETPVPWSYEWTGLDSGNYSVREVLDGTENFESEDRGWQQYNYTYKKHTIIPGETQYIDVTRYVKTDASNLKDGDEIVIVDKAENNVNEYYVKSNMINHALQKSGNSITWSKNALTISNNKITSDVSGMTWSVVRKGNNQFLLKYGSQYLCRTSDNYLSTTNSAGSATTFTLTTEGYLKAYGTTRDYVYYWNQNTRGGNKRFVVATAQSSTSYKGNVAFDFYVKTTERVAVGTADPTELDEEVTVSGMYYEIHNKEADKNPRIGFTKYALDTKDVLPGAELKVISEDGTYVKTWTSGSSKQDISLPAGKYYLEETSAPEGYACVPKITFTVDESGQVTITEIEGRDISEDYSDLVTVDDTGINVYDPNLVDFKVIKTWEDGLVKEPITLQLLKDGVAVEGQTITLDGSETPIPWTYEWKNLELGTYSVEEVLTGNESYRAVYRDSHEMSFSYYETTTVSGDEIMEEVTKYYKVSQSDLVDGQKIILVDQNEVYINQNFQKPGKIGSTFIPSGYTSTTWGSAPAISSDNSIESNSTNDALAWTVELSGTSAFYLKNSRGYYLYRNSSGYTSLTSNRNNANRFVLADDGTLKLYDSSTYGVAYFNNQFVITTLGNGTNVFFAMYGLQTKQIGTGKYDDKTEEKEIKVTGTYYEVYNEQKPPTGEIKLVKVDQDDSTILLNNASFEIWKEDNNSEENIPGIAAKGFKIDTQQTSENGELTFIDLEYGTYYIIETNAPEGYQLSSVPIKVIINENGAALAEDNEANNATLTKSVIHNIDGNGKVTDDEGTTDSSWSLCINGNRHHPGKDSYSTGQYVKHLNVSYQEMTKYIDRDLSEDDYLRMQRALYWYLTEGLSKYRSAATSGVHEILRHYTDGVPHRTGSTYSSAPQYYKDCYEFVVNGTGATDEEVRSRIQMHVYENIENDNEENLQNMITATLDGSGGSVSIEGALTVTNKKNDTPLRAPETGGNGTDGLYRFGWIISLISILGLALVYVRKRRII